MVGSLFSSDAWHNIAFTAGEIRNVRRTLPLSMVLGTLAVTTLYLVVNVAYLSALPVMGDAEAATVVGRGIAHAREDRVATAVMELAEPRFGVSLMAAAIMVSTFGCANGLILMGARLYYAIAADGLFFRAVGRLNSRAVPAAGIHAARRLGRAADFFRLVQRAARLLGLRRADVLFSHRARAVRAALQTPRRTAALSRVWAIRCCRPHTSCCPAAFCSTCCWSSRCSPGRAC